MALPRTSDLAAHMHSHAHRTWQIRWRTVIGIPYVLERDLHARNLHACAMRAPLPHVQYTQQTVLYISRAINQNSKHTTEYSIRLYIDYTARALRFLKLLYSQILFTPCAPGTRARAAGGAGGCAWRCVCSCSQLRAPQGLQTYSKPGTALSQQVNHYCYDVTNINELKSTVTDGKSTAYPPASLSSLSNCALPCAF